MDVPADVGGVQVKKDAQNMHGAVLAEIEQRDQQPLAQGQLEDIAPSSAPDASGAEKVAVMRLRPHRLQFTQELIELDGTQPYQPLERTCSGLLFLQSQHPSTDLPCPLLRNRS